MENEEAYNEIKKIIRAMFRMTNEEFTRKYINDPFFNRGVDVLVDLLIRRN